MLATNFCALVEAAAWGDAEFYGRWLLAAAQAEAFWKEALKELEFEKQVQCVCVCYFPDFGISASIMLMELQKYRSSFIIDLQTEEAADFAMMLSMGFFVPVDGHYKMSVPSTLTKASVKEAIIQYAETEDEEFVLHPERIVNSFHAQKPVSTKSDGARWKYLAATLNL